MATIKQLANKIRSLKKQITRTERQKKNAMKRVKKKSSRKTSRRRRR
ncbi:hypothetical protein J4413_04660 [Candidatus Woesearchaeota archaeon]|nr:hypothetical protein [Candidatus Woesearchaeota archaeon]